MDGCTQAKTEQRLLPWQQHAVVMGVINRSADSFYNVSSSIDTAIDAAAAMVAAGAAIVDIGAEATNPSTENAPAMAAEYECELLIPTIEALRSRFKITLSVDTSCVAVMKEAITVGADMINDQRALAAVGAKELVAQHNIPVCLMHFPEGRPADDCSPQDLLQGVIDDLTGATRQCIDAGIAVDNIIWDPGFGSGRYGKSFSENYYLLAQLAELAKHGFPVLVGWSRKSMLTEILGDVPPAERLFASLSAALYAHQQGARILRVHDVKATVDALKLWQHITTFE